ncbi:MAG: hypothetical protein Q9175_002395 [Cornicularia normoerica]
METNAITRRYRPKPQNAKDSRGLRAKRERPKLLFRVGSSVWEICQGDRWEGGTIGDLQWSEGQGTWSYLAKNASGTKELGWLEEYSLTSSGPSVDVEG